MVIERTREQISAWEKDNKEKIIKWVRDFGNNTIQFCFDEKCTISFTFKII